MPDYVLIGGGVFALLGILFGWSLARMAAIADERAGQK